jgi:hypothetical protein
MKNYNVLAFALIVLGIYFGVLGIINLGQIITTWIYFEVNSIKEEFNSWALISSIITILSYNLIGWLLIFRSGKNSPFYLFKNKP